ncbi:MAG: hypothetical protein ABR503_15335, partial [Chitinophagaceae bacterium]
AIACPIPRLAPVTIAVFPLKLKSSFTCILFGTHKNSCCFMIDVLFNLITILPILRQQKFNTIVFIYAIVPDNVCNFSIA